MGNIIGRTLFRPSDIPTNLVGYWKFNNDATDSSTSGYNLTGTGTPTYNTPDYWSSGEKYVDYNGSSQYHSIAHASCPNLALSASAYTVSCWIKPETVSGTIYLASKFSGTHGWSIIIANGVVKAYHVSSEVGASATSLVANRWYHICGVYTKTAYLIYINGNLDSITAGTTDADANTTDFEVAGYNGTTNMFTGWMKDLSIWSSALTPLQIKSLALGQDLSRYSIRPNSALLPTPTTYWKLNDIGADGTNFNRLDSIGSLHLTAAGQPRSRIGYMEGVGVSFSGGTEYLSASDNTAFDFSGGLWSVGVWLYIDTTDRIIFSQGTDASNYIALYITGGVLKLAVYASGSYSVEVVGTTTIPTGKWVHVAVVENGNSWKLYLNGVDDTASGGTDSDRAANYSGSFRVGCSWDAGGNYWAGKLSDFAIWKGTALSAAQVSTLACGLDINAQGLVSYWKMDGTGNETDVISGKVLTETSGTIDSATGKVGNARDFEAGDTEYFDAGDDAAFEPAYFSISCFVKPETIGSNMPVVTKRGTGDNGYEFGISTLGSPYLFAEGVSRATTSTMSAGAWYQMAASYNGVNASVYFNGKNEIVGALTYTTDTDGNFKVGGDAGITQYYDGLIDELLFFKRSVFDEEATALYIKGLNAKEATNSEIETNQGGFFAIF